VSIVGAIGAAAGLGSSIFGGITQANAAQAGASAQESKAQQAQALELQNQQAGIAAQNQVWSGTQAAEAPYQALGQTSANAYTNLLNNPFTAPTLTQAENTPGYQFNLQTGTQAINENAAATGNLNSGNTGVALQKFGQGLATTTYQQAYNNALQSYSTNLNAAGQGVNVGLNSTQQLGTFGQQNANNLSNLYLTGGQQQASQLNNQGAAIAAGDVGAANAYANMANGATNAITGGLAMSAIGTPGGLSGSYYPSSGLGTPYGTGTMLGGTYYPAGSNPYSSITAPTAYSPIPANNNIDSGLNFGTAND
jgi:hypothetical protein